MQTGQWSRGVSVVNTHPPAKALCGTFLPRQNTAQSILHSNHRSRPPPTCTLPSLVQSPGTLQVTPYTLKLRLSTCTTPHRLLPPALPEPLFLSTVTAAHRGRSPRPPPPNREYVCPARRGSHGARGSSPGPAVAGQCAALDGRAAAERGMGRPEARCAPNGSLRADRTRTRHFGKHQICCGSA
jgi:hypothetical protein